MTTAATFRCDHCNDPTPDADLLRCDGCASYLCTDCHTQSPRPCCGATHER